MSRELKALFKAIEGDLLARLAFRDYLTETGQLHMRWRPLWKYSGRRYCYDLFSEPDDEPLYLRLPWRLAVRTASGGFLVDRSRPFVNGLLPVGGPSSLPGGLHVAAEASEARELIHRFWRPRGTRLATRIVHLAGGVVVGPQVSYGAVSQMALKLPMLNGSVTMAYVGKTARQITREVRAIAGFSKEDYKCAS